jgi:predicted aldo/keto reductase-like oxidoreductase
MQYRKFGKLDWQVSALGFGAMRMPTVGGVAGNIDQDKVDEMIQTAIEGGVNYFDTAYVYHDQKSEAALGKALGSRRNQVRVATKSAIWFLNDGDGFQRMLDEQLSRLQTDHIDFYLLHALNKNSFKDKVQKLNLIKEAEKALADGRIKHIGFSFHDNLDVFKEIIDFYDKWDFCQIQYNYMDIENQAGTVGLKYAADKDIAVVIMEPLRGGKLAQDLPFTRPIWESASETRTPADWALQWLWNQPEVAVTLSGMSTLEQVKQNIASASQAKISQLSDKELGMFVLAKEVMEGRSPIPCTKCEYCMPCPNGVNIPGNFDLYNEVAMYEDVHGSRHVYNNFMGEPERAAQCIQCDECLDKCPQHIQISDWMPVIEDVLGKNQDFVASL